MSERNLKSTIVELLHKAHLLSAGAILDALKSEGKTYNKTSVYRALDQLEKDNILCRHHFNDEAVYEVSGHEHIHLVCTHCGTVKSSEVQLPQLKELDGFVVQHQHTSLLGLCDRCN